MLSLQTFPSQQDMEHYASEAPAYMHPNDQPLAVVMEGFLSAEECGEIVDRCLEVPSYQFGHCNATTREIGHIPELTKVCDMALRINEAFWDYDLDTHPVSWMQSYESGQDYDIHADGRPGQMRKLTAVVMLSPTQAYVGGTLELFWPPVSYKVPNLQGTIVCFQPWVFHRVHSVVNGLRRTINMGFWGPNFR